MKISLNGAATLLAATAFMSSMAYATPFDGAYDQAIENCYRTSDSRLIISGDTYEFWEGGCHLTNPTSVRGISSAMIYDAACSAEDSQYSNRVMLIGNSHTWLGNEQIGIDLYVVRNNSVSQLVRCPAGVGTQMYR